VVYSNVVYFPNVVVGWRSEVRRRRLCINNTKVLKFVIEMQRCVSFALFSSYKIFRIVNNISIFRSSCKVPDSVVLF